MRGKDLFTPQETFHAFYENVDGLEASNPVVIKGHKIGLVNEIEFMQSNNHRFMVTFSIKDDFPVPDDSKARIINMDVMGTKALEIILGNSDSYLSKNDSLAGEVALSLTATINNIVAPITNKTNKILAEIEKYLQGGKQVDFKKLYDDLAQTSSNLQEASQKFNDYMISEKLKSILANIENISQNLDENKDQINKAMANIAEFSDSLKSTDLKQTISRTNEVMKTLDEITAKINNGEGSIGLLVNNDSLYNNLNSTTENLNKLIIDLKENPSDYVQVSVFGKKDKKDKK